MFHLECLGATKYLALLSTVTGITHSECVSVALVIQHAKSVRLIILPFVACLVAVPHFSTLSHKRQDFRKKEMLKNIKCIF
jgi:hypothetical protein